MSTGSSMPTTTSLRSVAVSTMSPREIATAQALAKLLDQFKMLQVLYTVGYGVMFMLSVACIVYLRRNRTTAYLGDSDAARKILLPSFEPLIWVMAIITGIVMVYFILATAVDYTKPLFNKIFGDALYQGRQFIMYLVLTFVLQRSVTRAALYRSMGISLAIAGVPFASVSIADYLDASALTALIIPIAFRAICALGLIVLCFYPVGRANQRAIREFCGFLLIYYTLVTIYAEVFYLGYTSAGIILVIVTVAWASAAPFVVYRLLRADTQHWRGLGERAADLQHVFRQQQQMEEIVSAQGLHVLLEMHQRDIIDFAHLELKRKIGIGASADVYEGLLQNKAQVAVKVYSPSEITESTIVDFSQEAALCSALKHPNIVTFYGMCVCPPTICLVAELCRGSLEDKLAFAKHDYTEPLLVQLCFMLDAARAVAYLHSFSPPFIHRDIKPANFLVDASNVVKLTDFGESRSLAAKAEAHAAAKPTNARLMTIRGTADYMAPELIEGKQGAAVYSESADIYSLAITLWDVLHPGREKYPASNNNSHKVFQMVLDGQRPPVDPELHPIFRDLLESAWLPDPEFRPSAAAIVSHLETFLEEVAGGVAQRLARLVQHTTTVVSKAPKRNKKDVLMNYFTGDEGVLRLIEAGYAFEVEEAIRMGNALMDAGCLHHAGHAKAFERSASSCYYFDEAHIDLVQPLQRTKTASSAGGSIPVVYVSNASDSDGILEETSVTDRLYENGGCPCRKLAQGHDSKPKVPKHKQLFRRKKVLGATSTLTVNLLNDAVSEDFAGFATGETVLSDPRPTKSGTLTA